MRFVKWYIPFVITIVIVFLNLVYEEKNKPVISFTYHKENDDRVIMLWDSVKVLHDSQKEYASLTETNFKIRIESIIRDIKPTIIRQDSLLLLTLSEDSLYKGRTNNLIRCFYIGPIQEDIFKVGNRVVIFGYRNHSTVTQEIVMKADFIERYTIFSELSRLGMQGYQILGLLAVIAIASFFYTAKKLKSV